MEKASTPSKQSAKRETHAQTQEGKLSGSVEAVELSPFSFSESTEYATLLLQIPKDGESSQSNIKVGKEKVGEKDFRPSSVASNGKRLERSLSMDRMSSSDGLIGSSGSNNNSGRTTKALGLEATRSMVRGHSPNAKSMHKAASIFAPKHGHGDQGNGGTSRAGRQIKQPTVAIVQDPLSMSGSVARPQPPSTSTPGLSHAVSGAKNFGRTRSTRANLSNSIGPGTGADLAQSVGPGSKEASLSDWPSSKLDAEASERALEIGKLRARLQHLRERIQRESGRVQEHTVIMENQSQQLVTLNKELTETKAKYSSQMNSELKKFNDMREKTELLSASVQRRVAEGGSLGERRILIDEKLQALKELRSHAFVLPPTAESATATIDPHDVVNWAQDRAMEKEWLKEEKAVLEYSEFPATCDDPAVLERWWNQGKGATYTAAELRQSYLAVADLLASLAPVPTSPSADAQFDPVSKNELSSSNLQTSSDRGLINLGECPSAEFSAASFQLRGRSSARDGLTLAAAERLGSRSPSGQGQSQGLAPQESPLGPGLEVFCKRASFFEHVLRYDLLLLSTSREIHDRFVLRTSTALTGSNPFLPDQPSQWNDVAFPHPSLC